ncbi:outer membrane beta-barrel family protein [Tenacibaculum jejuense]|uniref:Probable TonB-dependent outer membrane receptor n=1 Tax=Tenacibaculum jejuense TaxID=584609 RepID=A0A238UF06_9FLAO|nr:outer membrane beta-barrel family protein [Tenacibaculum jejuense]SNR16990.1 Probable TonB-dependent outer membrane receptor precursor [Tenacibaculum jejuense]
MRVIILCALLLNICVFSQVTVKGKVVDKKTKQPLEFATIIVMKSESEKFLTGTSANEKGEFSVEVKPDIYDIKVDFVGFKPITIKLKKIEKFEDLGTLFLEENSTQLEEVEIRTERSTTEYKLDKRIFNVGKDLIAKGGNATDILNNVPSVNVDLDGAVSLRGNANVRILINGKPSVLTSNNGLEQLPASTIERVEVITNPSARYDAEGTAGILNIILKKNKIGGFSSSLQLTTGEPANHGINYNVNYKKETFNVFANARYSLQEFEYKGSIFRENFDGNGPTSFLDLERNTLFRRNVFNLYVGSDIYFNKQNTTTFSYFLRSNVSKRFVDFKFDFFDSDKSLQNSILNRENYREPQNFSRIEFNHVKKFTKKGQQLTIDVQYDFWDDDENEFVEEDINGNSPNILQSRDIESSKDLLFQADFKLPLQPKTHLELGIKGEVRDIDSDYKVWDNGILIDSLDNLLTYKERIYAAYVQYGNRKNKLQYLLGLRGEYTNTSSTDRKNVFETDKRYSNLFPTVHLTYNFNERTNLQLSYSKRIRRPRFWQLNPFGGIADRRNIRVGNPDLNPMFTDAFDVGFLKKWKGFTINPSVYYQYTTQLFETLVSANSDGAIISKQINSGTEHRVGAELGIQYAAFSWWRLMGEINYFSFQQQGLFNVKDNAWTAKLNSRMKLPAVTIQTNLNYQGERASGQIITEPIFVADLGLSKDFWNDKISVTANIQNVFNSRVQTQTISGADYTILNERALLGPQFRLNVTYRFNRNKKDRDRLPD